MTTIVYRDGVLAADAAVFDRGVFCATAVKIIRSDCGWLGGAAGCLGDCAAFAEFIARGPAGPGPYFKDEESEGLLISPTGDVEWVGAGGKRFRVEADFHAIGSGHAIAMGALAAGADAETAVEIACELDAFTRGPVTVLRLKDPEGGGA